MTIEKVFKSEGISQEGQATAEKFMGSRSEVGDQKSEVRDQLIN